jgi:hypothetical protein
MVLVAVVLAISMWALQTAPLEWRYWLTGLIAGLTWAGVIFALWEGLSGIEWLTLPLSSALLTTGAGLFYVLLPPSIAARFLIIVLFGVGQYALMLSGNIFSVAAIRTIALVRAASAVEFVMSLLTGFLLFNTILSFRLSFWATGLWTSLVSFLLLVPGLWSIQLLQRLTKQVILYSATLAVMMGLCAVAITFWPISLSVSSLFLCTMLYIYLGISQHHFSQRLFAKTVGEYVTVGAVVLVTMLLTAGWGV